MPGSLRAMAVIRPDDRAGAALRGLVVEDQVLIGLSIEAYLEELGMEVGGPFQRGADALRWLARARPDFAIIDYALRDGPCLELASTLGRMGVPFVVYSGYRQRAEVAGPLERAVWIEKPAPRHAILAALARILPRPDVLTGRGEGQSEMPNRREIRKI